jgi:membrane protease subunit (stomatin/prohibitin family)
VGLFDKIRGEFIDIIEWLDPSSDTIAYRFERYNNEIKMGAKLTVRPGQKAVFVNEGQVADTFEPGMYELATQNLPLLSTLKGWKYGFNSPFKAEVYFFSTKIFTNLKWGTANPIIIRDQELGPIRLRAFGSYNIRVADPRQLLQELVSTDGLFQVEEVSDQIRNMIMTAFATWTGTAGIPILDFAARYGELGETIRTGMQPEIQRFGLELTQLLIENISLPPEVETALDKRTSMGILGNMQQYAQFQAANAIEASANNPNGGGTPALDFGVGIAMGQQLMSAMQPTAQPIAQPTAPATAQPMAAPPPPPPAIQWHLSREGQNFGPFPLNQLLQNGLTAQTYVWRSGMANWLRAAEVPEVAALLAAVPPPPPVG